MTTTPTLDTDRTDQLRTFLVTEAAADAASSSSPAHRPHRVRLVVGIAAAVLLAGAITVGTSLGGPGAERADAVAIEQADGWTTVRLIDIDADPQAVVDELQAAGIDARVGDATEVGLGPDGADLTDGSFGVGMVSATPQTDTPGFEPGDGATGTATVTGALPVGDGVELEDGTGEPDELLEAAGIRFGDVGEISIRDGADVRVVVYRG